MMQKLLGSILVILFFAQPAVCAVLYFSDFESGDGGMKGTLDWEYGFYLFGSGSNCYSTTYTPPTGAHSGTNMWGTVLDNCYNNLGNNEPTANCGNSDITDDSILSFDVDLTKATPPITLIFWNWHDGATNYDFGEVYVNGDELFEHCPNGNGPDFWQEETIDISSYTGTIAVIEFHFICSDVQAWSGWYIDDVTVEDSLTGPTPTPTATGMKTPTGTVTSTATISPTGTMTFTGTPPEIPETGGIMRLVLVLMLGVLVRIIPGR